MINIRAYGIPKREREDTVGREMEGGRPGEREGGREGGRDGRPGERGREGGRWLTWTRRGRQLDLI